MALWSPNTSVADCQQVSQAQFDDAIEAGVQIQVGQQLVRVARSGSGLRLTTSNGETIEAVHLVNAAGLYADRIAHMCNVGLQYCVGYKRSLLVRRYG